MEPAFLRFGMKGEILQTTDVDRFKDNDIEGVNRQTLKDILTYGGKSCWSPNDPNDSPETYTGLPGLARLIASSKKLSYALAVQIQQNFANLDLDDATTAAIVDSYEKNGKSLQAALQGYLLSEPYQCAEKGQK